MSPKKRRHSIWTARTSPFMVILLKRKKIYKDVTWMKLVLPETKWKYEYSYFVEVDLHFFCSKNQSVNFPIRSASRFRLEHTLMDIYLLSWKASSYHGSWNKLKLHLCYRKVFSIVCVLYYWRMRKKYIRPKTEKALYWCGSWKNCCIYLKFFNVR